MVQDEVFEKKEIENQREFFRTPNMLYLNCKENLKFKEEHKMEAVVTIAIVAALMGLDKLITEYKTYSERKKAIRKRSCIKVKKTA